MTWMTPKELGSEYGDLMASLTYKQDSSQTDTYNRMLQQIVWALTQDRDATIDFVDAFREAHQQRKNKESVML